MLVLSRKVGEAIKISQDIRVTVQRIGGGAVRLGIEAPEGVNIWREELEGDDGTRREPKPARIAHRPNGGRPATNARR